MVVHACRYTICFKVFQNVCYQFDGSRSTQDSGVSKPLVCHSKRGQIHGNENVQRSEECKHPPFLGTSLQPQLGVQENAFLEGNKTKLGF